VWVAGITSALIPLIGVAVGLVLYCLSDAGTDARRVGRLMVLVGVIFFVLYLVVVVPAGCLLSLLSSLMLEVSVPN